MKRSVEPEFVGVANERLVSTLTQNLANMEHFSRRDAVSSDGVPRVAHVNVFEHERVTGQPYCWNYFQQRIDLF